MVNVYDDTGAVTEYQVSNGNVTTTINGINISNTGGYMSNNHPGVTSLLYNFSQAKNLVLPLGNFQGTLFAPDADATDGTVLGQEGAKGHLSGALIAKSFEGNIEFGYRPYTGPASVLGLNMKYVVKVLKTDATGTELIPGATFTLYSIEGETEIPVATGISGEDGIAALKVPSEGTYVIRETVPAPGYSLGDTEYRFKLEKDPNSKTMIQFEQGIVTVAGDTRLLTLDDIIDFEQQVRSANLNKDDLTFDWLTANNYVVNGNPDADSEYGTDLSTLRQERIIDWDNTTIKEPEGVTVTSLTFWLSQPLTGTHSYRKHLEKSEFEYPVLNGGGLDYPQPAYMDQYSDKNYAIQSSAKKLVLIADVAEPDENTTEPRTVF